ncbi:hypothetical protein G7068_09470 [Leucobacter viscericola]|uniref:Uncharacterized protein n=1 Tax=Leucobacter viscericola TaxID=2714935 RepID=A0A6G7XFW6_9MICO|nr:hypothetical protein [Leucobacter viscericola]QIK63402.1 hypothetical protein G7068_09470 [Leucobacter viscericola]
MEPRWIRGRYDAAAAAVALRSAPVNVSPDGECWIEIQVGELDIEVWFPHEPGSSEAPSLDTAASVIAQLTAFDDVIQAELEEASRVSVHEAKNFMFDLSTIVMNNDREITLSYIGSEVNSEFDVRFEHRDGAWHRV